MKLNAIPDCSKEEFSSILDNKYGNDHQKEKNFFFGLWCIKSSMSEISSGPYKAILKYTEYPLNELIKDIELHYGDEKYFEIACKELQKIYNRLLITNICCIEFFEQSKKGNKKIKF